MEALPPPHDSGDLSLTAVESPDSSVVGCEFSLSEGRLTLGRAADCDVTIDDPTVSRLHAEIRVDGERILLLDRGSANGTWIAESRVDRVELHAGDRFRIGASVFEAANRKPKASTPPPAPAGEIENAGPTDLSSSVWRTVVAESIAPPQEDLSAAGEEIVVSGNRPFLLDAPDFCWLVEAGQVEVFGVEVADGKPVGARWHYLSVMPGEAAFGMNLHRDGGGSGFLAVGRAGTLLRRIRLSGLRAVATAAGHSGIPRIVDSWINGMSKSLVRDLSPRPRVDESVFEDAEVALAANQKLSSAKDVLWLEGERLRLLFLGLEEVECSPGRLFPVTPDSWVEVVSEPDRLSPLCTRATGDRITDPALWRGLEQFHQALCRCDFLIQRLGVVDEFNRLKTKAEYSEAAAQAGFERLTEVMEPAAAERERGAPESGDPLLAAIQRIGAAMGAEIRSHPELDPAMSFSDRLTRIAKASNLRTRQVALRDAWWRADQGPILARWAGSGEPVALLPKGARAYEYFDPASGKKRRADAKLAERLESFAHVLYSPLPARAVTLPDLLRFGLRGFGKDLWTLVAMGVGLGVLGALAPYFTGRIFDAAIPEAERGLLTQFGFVLVVAALASTAFKITQSIAVLRIEGRMDYTLESALWNRLLNLPSTFFRRYAAGDLGERAGGVSAIRHALTGTGVSAILGSFSSIFFVGLMLWYDLKLGAIAVALCLLFVAVTTAVNLIQLRFQREELDVRGQVSGLVLQIVAGVGKIRVAGAENHAFHVWAEQFAEQRQKSFRVGRLENVLAMVNSAFPLLASMIVFWVLAAQAQDRAAGATGGLSTGQFIGFFAAFAQFLAAMQALADASLNLVRIVPLYERLRPILTTTPESDESKAWPGRLKGGIEISHLHFRYGDDSPWVLRDVTLTIKPGEFVAFVGASGSGKSTLMRLMLGFETPQRGSIYYDGQDLRNLDLREFRQQLGVVLQESMVLPADLYRNIVGSSSRTLEEAKEAARQAGLDDDIREMPMGIHTYVGEGGGGLSGGQRQRLLIARAIVAKPRILLMDEATSALDNRSQARVTESLARLQATRILIAHRLSTIINADRICVFDNGVIAETGTYEELMQKDGLFAQLVRRQK